MDVNTKMIILSSRKRRKTKFFTSNMMELSFILSFIKPLNTIYITQIN